MRSHLIALILGSLGSMLCFSALGIGARPDKESAEEAVKALQGEWVVQAVEQNGKGTKQPGNEVWVFKGNLCTWESPGLKVAYGIRVDPSKQPKQMTLRLRDGDTFAAIYEIKGDALKVAYTSAMLGAPDKFATIDGDFVTLVTLKRKAR